MLEAHSALTLMLDACSPSLGSLLLLHLTRANSSSRSSLRCSCHGAQRMRRNSAFNGDQASNRRAQRLRRSLASLLSRRQWRSRCARTHHFARAHSDARASGSAASSATTRSRSRTLLSRLARAGCSLQLFSLCMSHQAHSHSSRRRARSHACMRAASSSACSLLTCVRMRVSGEYSSSVRLKGV